MDEATGALIGVRELSSRAGIIVIDANVICCRRLALLGVPWQLCGAYAGHCGFGYRLGQ